VNALLEKLREASNSPGAAPLHAAWRAGLKDLQTVVLSPIEGTMATKEEPGGIASPTSYIITEQMKGKELEGVEPEM
jgi:hypothetical protein